jgi:hypothetical protein
MVEKGQLHTSKREGKSGVAAGRSGTQVRGSGLKREIAGAETDSVCALELDRCPADDPNLLRCSVLASWTSLLRR